MNSLFKHVKYFLDKINIKSDSNKKDSIFNIDLSERSEETLLEKFSKEVLNNDRKNKK